MNKLMISIFLTVLLYSCNSSYTPREMNSMEVMGQLKNDFAVLIDVREKNSVKELAESARWIPLSVFKENEKTIDHVLDSSMNGKIIVVYGENIKDAQAACLIIVKSGKECNFLPGFADWKKNNLPTRLISTN